MFLLLLRQPLLSHAVLLVMPMLSHVVLAAFALSHRVRSPTLLLLSPVVVAVAACALCLFVTLSHSALPVTQQRHQHHHDHLDHLRVLSCVSVCVCVCVTLCSARCEASASALALPQLRGFNFSFLAFLDFLGKIAGLKVIWKRQLWRQFALCAASVWYVSPRNGSDIDIYRSYRYTPSSKDTRYSRACLTNSQLSQSIHNN